MSPDNSAPGRSPGALGRGRPAPETRDQLLLRHLPLAYSAALAYTGPTRKVEDRIAVARLGLVAALDTYDRARAETFPEHAEPIIAGELDHWLRADAPPIATLEAGSAWRRAVEGAQRTIREALRRQDHVHELAGYLHCDLEGLVDGLIAAVESDDDLLRVSFPERRLRSA